MIIVQHNMTLFVAVHGALAYIVKKIIYKCFSLKLYVDTLESLALLYGVLTFFQPTTPGHPHPVNNLFK